MRLEPDRRHLVVPVIGKLRSQENIRRLERLVAKGRTRVLSMTLAEQGGRLVVSVQAIVAHQPPIPADPAARCGIDLGIGQEWAVIAHHYGTIERVAHPAPWAALQRQRRRAARQLSRRTVGSRAHCHTKAMCAALDRRAANLRINQLHTLTTTLTRRYGTIVVEDLDVQAMGRRAFRRTACQARIGKVRPTLAYKCGQQGGRLVVADRWLVLQDPSRLRRLPGRSSVGPTGLGLSAMPAAGGPQRQRGVEPPRLDRRPGRRPCRRPGYPAGWSCRPGAVRGRPRRAGSRAGVGVRGSTRPSSGGRADDATTEAQPRLGSGTPSRGTSQQALTNAH
jgi:hypothetical protein